jgi:glucose/arabinose dehydrogenase
MKSILIAAFAVCASVARAVTVPANFTSTPVVEGISRPTTMTFAPDGRLFVCEQGGKLRVVKNGALLATPFLTVTVDSDGERGLLGVAFDPDFATDPYVYVYYTAPTSPRHNRISRFTANGDTTVPKSELVLMDLDNLSSATNHNGGAIHFGKDGKLYAGIGENANRNNAQTLTNRLGKMLRINKDGTIPEDNPFYGTALGANRAIWALGLRNPFTFAVQPGTGRIFINDVGEVTWEEVNDGVAGSNYGWPVVEGVGGNAAYRDPLLTYPHSGLPNESGCAISGGAFYNPVTPRFPPEYTGAYFFADLCGAWIRRFDPDTGQSFAFATGLPSQMVDVKIGDDGSLYYLARGGGVVGKISYVPPPYTLADAGNALKLAAGLAQADAGSLFRLNVVNDGASDGAVDLQDAVAVLRKVPAPEG